MSTIGTLVIAPKFGRFEKDFDLVGKMDPFVVVIFDGERKATEVAKKQGKEPAWTASLAFALRQEHLNRPEIQIVIETYDDDGPNKKEFIGTGILNFSEIRSAMKISKTVSIHDKKKKQVGIVQLDASISIQRDTNSRIQQSSGMTSPKTLQKARGLGKGTLIVRPKTARLKRDTDIIGKMDPYVIVILNDQAFITNSATAAGKNPVWKDSLSYQLKGNEDALVFRIMDSDSGSADDLVGEACLDLEIIAQNLMNRSAEVTVNLEYREKDAGQLTLEFEYLSEVFGYPLKIYPSIEVRRGEYICKKIKYSNPDSFKKTITILPVDQSNLVQVRSSHLAINPKSYGEIRVKIYAPNHSTEATSRLDIFVEETKEVEESLIFKIRAI